MIHQFKNNGYNIVMDVNSGAIHVVDDLVCEIISRYETDTEEKITDDLMKDYDKEEIKEAYGEVALLKDQGKLFTKDTYLPYLKSLAHVP